MVPLLNVNVSHLGEMAFVTVTPDDMDVFFCAPAEKLCGPSLESRHCVVKGNVWK